jgi:hypothetical protein
MEQAQQLLSTYCVPGLESSVGMFFVCFLFFPLTQSLNNFDRYLMSHKNCQSPSVSSAGSGMYIGHLIKLKRCGGAYL